MRAHTQVMLRFESPFETEVMIGMTLGILVDPRVQIPVCGFEHEEGANSESYVEWATKQWAFLLPSQNDNRMLLNMRANHGWSRQEIYQICRHLDEIAKGLDAASKDPHVQLEGTRQALMRDKISAQQIWSTWVALSEGQ